MTRRAVTLALLTLAVTAAPAAAAGGVTLTSPSASSVNYHHLIISYTLASTPVPGTVRLVFTQGATTVATYTVNSTATSYSNVFSPRYPSGGGSFSGPVGGLPNGTYTVTVRYQGASDGVTYSASKAGVTIDAYTEPATVTAPADFSRTGATLTVGYTLPEEADPGSAYINLWNTADGSWHELYLSDDHLAAGAHTVTFTIADPLGAGSPFSSMNGSAIPDGTFHVGLFYQDTHGNPYGYSEEPTVTIDRTTQAPTLTAPATSSTQAGGGVSVDYTLPEAALPGSVSLTLSRAGVTRTVTLDPTGGTSFTLNTASPLSSPRVTGIVGGATIPDGTYTATLAYRDDVGNPAAMATRTDVRIDSATETPALAGFADGETTTGSFALDFAIPEDALAGSTELRFASGGQTVSSIAYPITGAVTVTHSGIAADDLSGLGGSLTGASALPDGTYTVTVRYRDAAGNPVAVSPARTLIVARPVVVPPVTPPEADPPAAATPEPRAETPAAPAPAPSVGAPVTSTAPLPVSAPARLRVAWSRVRGRLVAKLARVTGAEAYVLEARWGKHVRRGLCRTRQRIRCAVDVPEHGRWNATLTVLDGATTLLRATKTRRSLS